MKLLSSPLLVMFQISFSQRALKWKLGTQEHSKSTWTLRVLKALKHLDTRNTLALEGHLGTRAVKVLGQSDTGALGHSKGTWARGHVDTQAIGLSRHSRHFIQQILSTKYCQSAIGSGDLEILLLLEFLRPEQKAIEKMKKFIKQFNVNL